MIGGRVEGDENATVSSFSKIEEGKPGAISFLSNPKYTHYIYDTQSSVVLTTLIRVANAYECVAKLLQFYESMKPRKTGVDPLAFVSPSAKIGENCYIGAFAVIEDNAVVGDGCQIYPHCYVGQGVTIGNDSVLYPHVVIYYGCKVGQRVILHAGCVIGADGFGFAPSANGYDKIPQIGIVTIEDDVEIGANACVDRSTMGSTYVRRGVKLDNLVQIAHNTDIGENTVMSAQVGVAGSSKVGKWCMFGGQVGVAGHLVIGDKVNVGAQSGIIGNLKSDQSYMGSPVMDPKLFFKSMAVLRRLPEIYKMVNDMEKEIKELKKGKQA